MLIYSRFVPDDAPALSLVDTVDHVRAHLSSVVDADDDPNTRSGDVVIRYEQQDGGTLVVGELAGDPCAAYLRGDFDPDADDGYTFQRWEAE